MKGIYSKNGHFVYLCQGCNHTHYIPVTGPKAWGFNWNLEKPTLTPSVVEWHDGAPEDGIPAHRCHHFVREGQIDFLGDCVGHLRGVHEMLTIPAEWLDPKIMEMSGFQLERPG